MNYKNFIIALLLSSLYIFPIQAIAAEKITFSFLIFTRNISINELEEFSKTGKRNGFLKKLIKEKEKVSIQNLLIKEHKAPVQLTSRLLYSEIGEVILKRISKIIYPFKLKNKNLGVLAIKSSAIKAIDKKSESITLLRFLKAYPSKTIAIDVSELVKVMNKVESMSELISYFTNSPIEKLKNEPS